MVRKWVESRRKKSQAFILLVIASERRVLSRNHIPLHHSNYTPTHSRTHMHAHEHTLQFWKLHTLVSITHPMAYEPVLAPTVVTDDSNLNLIGESGFKHYLRTISKSLTPNTTPTTPINISATFAFPQSEVANEKVSSARIDELKESPGCAISSIDKADPGIMAFVALASASDTNNAFRESDFSTSILSSSFDSPPFSTLNNVEEVGVQETVQSPPEDPALYQRNSQLDSPPHGGQTISSILRSLFRRRASSTVRIPESSA